jgi:pimeloyl-ACP methyl ester carboxylesterase
MTDSATPAGQLAYSDNGVRTNAPTIVLIHGAGGCARDWPVEWRYAMNAGQTLGVRALPPTARLVGHRVIAIDLPGHGASGGPPCETVDGYADAVAAHLRAQGIGDAVLVGHSMGGAIALTMALRSPDLLSGIAVLGSAARLGVTPQILDGLASDFAATVDMIVKFSWARSAPAVYRETGRRHMRGAGQRTVLADFTACAGYDVREKLVDIAVPVLVVAGGADKMVPGKASRALAESVQDGRFVEIPDAGHFLHFEDTRGTTAAITSFLGTINRANCAR